MSAAGPAAPVYPRVARRKKAFWAILLIVLGVGGVVAGARQTLYQIAEGKALRNERKAAHRPAPPVYRTVPAGGHIDLLRQRDFWGDTTPMFADDGTSTCVAQALVQDELGNLRAEPSYGKYLSVEDHAVPEGWRRVAIRAGMDKKIVGVRVWHVSYVPFEDPATGEIRPK